MRASWVALIIMALVGVFLYSAVSETERHRAMRSAASARISLRALNKAQADFAKNYGGYSPSLKALGPPPPGHKPSSSAADLISQGAASGNHYGYRFEYKPGSKNEQGHITEYTVCAYPTVRFWLRGEPANFSTDQSGVVRYTWDNRCPGAADPHFGS